MRLRTATLAALAFALFNFGPRRALADSCVWTGAAGTNWSDLSNWNTCGALPRAPGANDSADIPSLPNQPVVSTTVTVGLVTVESNASLTVAFGGRLTLTSGLTGPGNLLGQNGSPGHVTIRW